MKTMGKTSTLKLVSALATKLSIPEHVGNTLVTCNISDLHAAVREACATAEMLVLIPQVLDTTAPIDRDNRKIDGKKYSEEFMLEVVRAVHAQGANVNWSATARKFGISRNTIRRWTTGNIVPA